MKWWGTTSRVGVKDHIAESQKCFGKGRGSSYLVLPMDKCICDELCSSPIGRRISAILD